MHFVSYAILFSPQMSVGEELLSLFLQTRKLTIREMVWWVGAGDSRAHYLFTAPFCLTKYLKKCCEMLTCESLLSSCSLSDTTVGDGDSKANRSGPCPGGTHSHMRDRNTSKWLYQWPLIFLFIGSLYIFKIYWGLQMSFVYMSSINIYNIRN